MNGLVITESGLLAAMHLVGAGGVIQAFASGNLHSKSDGNGTTVFTNMERMGGYDVRPIIQ
jgi:hypothetical protein